MFVRRSGETEVPAPVFANSCAKANMIIGTRIERKYKKKR